MLDIKELEKNVKRHKRIANEWAMQLHDLSGERLPSAYEELPELAKVTYAACFDWQQAVKALKEATD